MNTPLVSPTGSRTRSNTNSNASANSSSSLAVNITPDISIGDNIRKDLCTVTVLLQQVLELIETEPDPKVLKEQSLRLIDYIDRCCDLSKIRFKKRIFGYD